MIVHALLIMLVIFFSSVAGFSIYEQREYPEDDTYIEIIALYIIAIGCGVFLL